MNHTKLAKLIRIERLAYNSMKRLASRADNAMAYRLMVRHFNFVILRDRAERGEF